MEQFICSQFKISELRDFQIKCLQLLFEKKNTFVSYPTGSGKSLCYEGFPSFFSRHPVTDYLDVIVIVIEPLIAIMNEQVIRLQDLGFSAVAIGKGIGESERAAICNGSYTFVFANPETLLGDSHWREILASSCYQQHRILLVIDEVHTAVEWGEGQNSNPFRVWFGRLGELRSIIPHATVLLLTATCSASTRCRLKAMLALRDCHELTDTPDRTNIKLHVRQFKTNLQVIDVFQWVVDCIMVHKQQCPRIMIFCRSIDDCGKLYTMFRCALDQSVYDNVNMFHSNTLEYVKELIQRDMCDSLGKIRVLICTSAAGMGVNFSAVYYVVHYGPPYTADSLIQQMGRAGRDNCQSHHLLLYCNRQLRGVEAEVKRYISSSDCRRKTLMSLYGGKDSSVHAHNCCDTCSNVCACMLADCDANKRHPLYDCNYDDVDVGNNPTNVA